MSIILSLIVPPGAAECNKLLEKNDLSTHAIQSVYNRRKVTIPRQRSASTMILQLPATLENALAEEARRRGVPAEALVLDALRDRFLPRVAPPLPQDDWERRLFGAAIDCGVSVPDSAVSSDGLYE